MRPQFYNLNKNIHLTNYSNDYGIVEVDGSIPSLATKFPHKRRPPGPPLLVGEVPSCTDAYEDFFLPIKTRLVT